MLVTEHSQYMKNLGYVHKLNIFIPDYRFRQQFKKLSMFYKQASSLQYYRNLLTLPMLPSNPPNFLLQVGSNIY